MREELHNDERVKLETWGSVMILLEDYRALTFEPMYQRGLKPFASFEDRHMRGDKIELARKRHNALINRWEQELGRYWRKAIDPD
jgi:hypothetical protein